MGGADVPAALFNQAAVDNEDLKDVMGLPDESMGDRGTSVSGRAIYARQQAGEIATFNYKDNMTKAVEYTMEILIDLIPEIYDTERELRILGVDGAEDYKRVNQVVTDQTTAQPVRINDLSMGKYDVTVTSGPAFATQRQEAAEIYMSLTQGNPEIMGIAGDLIMKATDLPYAEDIGDRLKAMLPPQIQQMLGEDQEVPPEVQQMMQQAQQAMAQVEEHGRLVQAASAELEEDKSLNAQQKAEIKAELAKLKQAEAEFKAEIAETLANLTEMKADLITKGAGLLVREQEIGGSADGHIALDLTQNIDEILAQFMAAVDTHMGSIEEKTGWLAGRAMRRPVGGQTRREGGRLTADIEFDDGSKESVSAVREKGGLRIVPPE
jgi:hypothetical protein